VWSLGPARSLPVHALAGGVSELDTTGDTTDGLRDDRADRMMRTFPFVRA